jgi:hypothetical protein
VKTLSGAGCLALLLTACAASALPPDPPSAALQARTITVTRQDVRSVVLLDGSIIQDPPVPVRATTAGIVIKVLVALGTPVHGGDPVASVQPATGGVVSLRAGLGGIVTTIDVLPGQEASIGAEVAQVLPNTFEAEATVDPSLLYRFYAGTPVAVKVQIDKGPAPFDCPFVSLGIPNGASGGGGDPTTQSVYFRCRIPTSIRVFGGIRCVVAVTTAVATNALVIPLTSVEGATDTGFVTLVSPGGRQSTVLVQLGLSNGVDVQVLSGLKDGDTILDLPPSIIPSGVAGATAP